MKSTNGSLTILWGDVGDRARKIAHQVQRCRPVATAQLNVYGVPRGGIHAAQSLLPYLTNAQMVTQPEHAHVIIDDLIDSGATRERMAKEAPRIPFFALYDKQEGHKHLKDTWLVFPWESMTGQHGPQDAVTRLIQYLGDDPKRDGLKDTPQRVIKSYEELFSGYKVDVAEVFKTFDAPYDELILLKDVPFYSTCEHHMLPFHGRAHIAYVPMGGKVIGVSKLARLLEVYARRLQMQERITTQVTDALDQYLLPRGSACIIEATHLCCSSRGIGKQGAVMVTSSLTGCFRSDPSSRAELFQAIRG